MPSSVAATVGRINVILVFGPSGVGKSTLAWALHRRLSQTMASGFVDTDQIGMCYPTPEGDPGNHRIKAAGLSAIARNLGAAGTRVLVVSGMVEDEKTAGFYAEELGFAPHLIRLRADENVLRARLAKRAWNLHLIEASVAHARALDLTGFADIVVETSGRSVEELVDQLAGELPAGGFGQPGRAPDALATGGEASPRIIWIAGVRAVGKSAVAFGVFGRLLRAGQSAGYVDLAQLGLFAPPEGIRHGQVQAANLGAVIDLFAQRGTRTIVLSGEANDDVLALPVIRRAELELIELRADREALRDRLRRRSEGGGPPLSGDDLLGMDATTIERLAEAEMRDQQGSRLFRVVDSSAQSAEEIASAIVEGLK